MRWWWASPSAWWAAAPRERDERGSIAMFLLVSLVGLMLGALLVPMVLGQVRTTRFVSSRVQAVDVAQAGIDVVLGKIRTATDDSGLGTSLELPCAPSSSPITGSVQSATYSVTIAYYTVDPVKNPTATAMLCVSGYGTYETSSGTSTPSYAQITSVGRLGGGGVGTTAGRTLTTTYVLQTSNANVLGGTIASAGSGLCIDAGTATPVAGAVPTIQGCSTSTPTAAQQTFAYRTDLTLQLVSSKSTLYPTGLCLDTAAPPSAGKPVVLNACAASGVAPTYTQQWSNDDQGQFQASVPASSTTGQLSDQCLGVPAQTAGTALQMVTCFVAGTYYAWTKSQQVGAGGAVAPQWVNFKEFGSCLDVTYRDVNQDHLISYPCKQNPYQAAVLWNQRFSSPTIASGSTSATGQYYTTVPDGTKYCLTAPGTAGGYITVSVCNSSLATQQWTFYNGKVGSYAQKYTIVDTYGRCMGIGSPKGSETWSAIVSAQCDGSASQKWNAPANLTASTLQNTAEK